MFQRRSWRGIGDCHKFSEPGANCKNWTGSGETKNFLEFSQEGITDPTGSTCTPSSSTSTKATSTTTISGKPPRKALSCWAGRAHVEGERERGGRWRHRRGRRGDWAWCKDWGGDALKKLECISLQQSFSEKDSKSALQKEAWHDAAHPVKHTCIQVCRLVIEIPTKRWTLNEI